MRGMLKFGNLDHARLDVVLKSEVIAESNAGIDRTYGRTIHTIVVRDEFCDRVGAGHAYPPNSRPFDSNIGQGNTGGRCEVCLFRRSNCDEFSLTVASGFCIAI